MEAGDWWEESVAWNHGHIGDIREVGGVFGMQVANSITHTNTHLKKQAIPELGISAHTHTHTRWYTLIHDSCHRENVCPRSREAARRRWDKRGSLSGRPSVYTSSFSAAGLHLPLSLTWYFSSKCSQARKPLEDNPIQKEFYFPILDQPVYCRLHCYGAARLLLHCW